MITTRRIYSLSDTSLVKSDPSQQRLSKHSDEHESLSTV